MISPLAALERVKMLEVDRARSSVFESEQNLARAREVLAEHERAQAEQQLLLRKARERATHASTAEDLFASERYVTSLRADLEASRARVERAREHVARCRSELTEARQNLASLEAKRRVVANVIERAQVERARAKDLNEEDVALDMHLASTRAQDP